MSDSESLFSFEVYFDRAEMKAEQARILLETLRDLDGIPEPVEPGPVSPHGPMAQVRALLIERDGPNCYLCGRPCAEGKTHVDHIIPRSSGGSSDAVNLALACAKCNSEKASSFVSLAITSGRPCYHDSRLDDPVFRGCLPTT